MGSLPAGHCAYNVERFGTVCDSFRQESVGWLMRKVLFAGKEPDEGAATFRRRVADRAPEHRVSGLQRVEDKPHSRGGLDVKLDLASDTRERAQVVGQDDADHWTAWTSTDNTRGRSWTIVSQLSPPLGDA